MQQIYFQNDFVTIGFNKSKKLGSAEWRGQLEGPEFREAALMCADLIDRYNLLRWLADDRRMYPIKQADVTWSLHVLVPLLVSGPLLRMATLPSEYEGHKESIDILVDKGTALGKQIVFRRFTSEAEALSWLLMPFNSL